MEITVDQIIAWKPCQVYTRERVEDLWAGREHLTPLEILELPIPIRCRFWTLLREEIIPAIELHELACKFAESVLPFFEEGYQDDDRPRKAIETRRRWLRGEATDEELAAARCSASSAADAAWSAGSVDIASAADAAWATSATSASCAARTASAAWVGRNAGIDWECRAALAEHDYVYGDGLVEHQNQIAMVREVLQKLEN